MHRGIAFMLASMIAAPVMAQPASFDDARLGASAPELRAIVDDATRSGLPTPPLVAKTREGLAKGVAPARIVGVVRALEQSLATARDEARPFVAAPPPGLLKALVEAHAARVSAGDARDVLAAGGREHAISVLTDLVQRGYPSSPAARLIAALATNDRQLDAVVGQAERLRRIDDVSPRDAIDALSRANGRGLGLDHAEQALQAGDVDGENGRGPNRETSGARGPRSGGVAVPPHGKGH